MAAVIETILNVDGKNYLLTHCSYDFKQSVDHLGRARAGVRSGLIECTILGNDQDTLQFWAIDPLKMFDGQVTFINKDKITHKTLVFKKAYCVLYQETLVLNTSSIAYQFHLGISAAQLQLNGIQHDNLWSDLKLTY